MKKLAFLLLTISTGLFIMLLTYYIPLFYFRQGIFALVGVVVLLLLGMVIPQLERIIVKRTPWIFFIFTTLIVQLVLITTGGLASHFLVLLHLSFLGMSFLLSFGVAMLFLTFTLFLVIAHMVIDPQILQNATQNSEALLLFGASFITMIPVSYLITRQYRKKEETSKVLTKEVKIHEAILTDLSELVLVIDENGKIISLNDAVERVLNKSRAELLGQPILSVLLMKDEKEKLLNDIAIFQQQNPNTMQNVSLLTGTGMSKVNMAIKPIDNLDGKERRVSVVLSLLDGKKRQENDISIAQEAITRHDAMHVDLKNRLDLRGQNDLKDLSVMITKSEEDIGTIRDLRDAIPQAVPIDLASLCRQIVIQEQEYARVFGVLLDFSFVNFGSEDIKPLLAGGTPVSADQLTGPFFTASCDVKYVSILIQKLLAIAMMVVPKTKEKTIRLTVERAGTTDILVKVLFDNHMLEEPSLPNLFAPYYDGLSNRTELHFGTGLEGVIAKKISDLLQYPLQVSLTKDGERVVFLLWVKKGEKSLSAASQQNGTINAVPPRQPTQSAN